jgi:hypothetical protein
VIFVDVYGVVDVGGTEFLDTDIGVCGKTRARAYIEVSGFQNIGGS